MSSGISARNIEYERNSLKRRQNVSRINIKELKVIAGHSPWITPSELEAVLDDLALQLQEEIVGRTNQPKMVKDLPFIPGINIVSKIIEKINEFFGTAYESDLNVLMKHFNNPLKKN